MYNCRLCIRVKGETNVGDSPPGLFPEAVSSEVAIEASGELQYCDEEAVESRV